MNPPIPHAKSACVQGAHASLGGPVLQTKQNGAIRMPTTAVVEPWIPTWNCRLSNTWGRIGLASANVGLALPQVRENVAVAGNEEGRELVPTGGPNPERKHWSAPLDGPEEDEDDPPFSENWEI